KRVSAKKFRGLEMHRVRHCSLDRTNHFFVGSPTWIHLREAPTMAFYALSRSISSRMVGCSETYRWQASHQEPLIACSGSSRLSRRRSLIRPAMLSLGMMAHG